MLFTFCFLTVSKSSWWGWGGGGRMCYPLALCAWSPVARVLQGGTWWSAERAWGPSLPGNHTLSPHLSAEHVNHAKAVQAKVSFPSSRFPPARPRAQATWSFRPRKEHCPVGKFPVTRKVWLPLFWGPFCEGRGEIRHSGRCHPLGGPPHGSL